MKNNEEIFNELLSNYNKQKDYYKEKEKAYKVAYRAWDEEVETNGDRTKTAAYLGAELDKAVAELEKSRTEYNFLAHATLECLNRNLGG